VKSLPASTKMLKALSCSLAAALMYIGLVEVCLAQKTVEVSHDGNPGGNTYSLTLSAFA